MDAIKALSNILLYINRTKQYHTRSAAYDIIVKKNEQAIRVRIRQVPHRVVQSYSSKRSCSLLCLPSAMDTCATVSGYRDRRHCIPLWP